MHTFEATPTSQKVFLDASLGRVLSCDIVADHNSPELPTASMDGYAVKYDDLHKQELCIVGERAAGTHEAITLQAGEALKTFTGSIMCEGSDTLVPIENVTVDNKTITINQLVPEGFSVRAVGENYRQGETLITKGTQIGYAEIGVMASLNIAQVDVYKRITVGIISTGSEILDVGEPKQNDAQIRSSNHFTLEAIARDLGCKTVRYPLIKDDPIQIEKSIDDALERCDIVVTTGGVSVGDYDFVKEVIQKYEAIKITERVNIKPGQHIKSLKLDSGKYLFALPGFAYSSTVTFLLYVVPTIKYLNGLDPNHTLLRVPLEGSYKKKGSKQEFAVCNLVIEKGKYVANLDGIKQGSSAILTNMLGGKKGLLIRTEESGNVNAGEVVDVILL
jgi:molybdopterin molybdotransferase